MGAHLREKLPNVHQKFQLLLHNIYNLSDKYEHQIRLLQVYFSLFFSLSGYCSILQILFITFFHSFYYHSICYRKCFRFFSYN